MQIIGFGTKLLDDSDELIPQIEDWHSTVLAILLQSRIRNAHFKERHLKAVLPSSISPGAAEYAKGDGARAMTLNCALNNRIVWNYNVSSCDDRRHVRKSKWMKTWDLSSRRGDGRKCYYSQDLSVDCTAFPRNSLRALRVLSRLGGIALTFDPQRKQDKQQDFTIR